MLKEFCEYIESVTSFVVGEDLFAGYADSDTPDECVWVQENVPGVTSYQLTDKVEKSFQVVTRANDYFTARDNAVAIFEALHGKMQINLPVVGTGATYCANIEGTSPYYIGQDEAGKRYLFSVNFLLKSQEV
jgi:hypothetical protein